MLRRVAPAIGLFFLSPFVGEFLLGNMSIDVIFLLFIMAPMYGGGAIVCRELGRRTGRGWPAILLLALAYGIIEEGIACQTLFNPSYFGLDLLREGHIPALGMGAWWTLFVLTLHTVWSISAPIATMEALVPGRETTPWLGRVGLAVAMTLFVLGSYLVFRANASQQHFMASSAQLTGALVCSLLLAASAFLVPRWRMVSNRRAPSPWIAGAFSLLSCSAFLVVRILLADWPLVLDYLLLYGLAVVVIVRWSSREGWDVRHRFALAAGALLAYAWSSFPQQPIVGTRGTTDLVGNAVFTLIAIGIIAAAARTARRATESHAPELVLVDAA